MDRIGSSSKGLTRRDYFVGCALEALLRSKPMEVEKDRVVADAIWYGTKADEDMAKQETSTEAATK